MSAATEPLDPIGKAAHSLAECAGKVFAVLRAPCPEGETSNKSVEDSCGVGDAQLPSAEQLENALLIVDASEKEEEEEEKSQSSYAEPRTKKDAISIRTVYIAYLFICVVFLACAPFRRHSHDNRLFMLIALVPVLIGFIRKAKRALDANEPGRRLTPRMSALFGSLALEAFAIMCLSASAIWFHILATPICISIAFLAILIHHHRYARERTLNPRVARRLEALAREMRVHFGLQGAENAMAEKDGPVHSRLRCYFFHRIDISDGCKHNVLVVDHFLQAVRACLRQSREARLPELPNSNIRSGPIKVIDFRLQPTGNKYQVCIGMQQVEYAIPASRPALVHENNEADNVKTPIVLSMVHCRACGGQDPDIQQLSSMPATGACRLCQVCVKFGK